MNQVRYSTDNKDTNGITNAEIVSYFNDAQKFITNLVFKNNPYADLFKTQVEIAANSTGEYTIPEDCMATNAISMVEAKWTDSANNDGYSRIKPISESEASYVFGYYTRDNKVIITGDAPNANFTYIRITYFRRLKTVDVRQAKVSAVTPGVSIGLSATPTDLYLLDDHASAVDFEGNQVVADIYFSNTSGATLTTTDTTGVTTAHYIVAGKNACNAPELPEECEPYLLDYVRQRIYTRNNYDDANKQMYFTEQQRQDIVSLFSKNKKDDDTIPMTDISYLSF
jgi:hypothetical protein